VRIVQLPKLLPLPGQLKPLPGGSKALAEPADPHARVDEANGAARIQPTRAGYLNAISTWASPTRVWPSTMRRSVEVRRLSVSLDAE
jgi:hypothetical protein